LFTIKPDAKLKAEFRNLDLAPIASYLKKAMVYHIISGHLDANVNFVSKKGILDSKVDLTLNKFYVDELSQADAEQYKAKYGMLLPTALSLLREKNDSIHISFPVTGDLTDPKFSFSSKITELSRDAIKTAVITYYTPFGMISAAKTAFDIITALRFPSVTYKPGKYVLLDTDKKKLDNLIKLLNEKPYIQFSICGHATLQDRLAKFPDDEVEQMVSEYSADDSGDDSPSDLDAVLPKLFDSEIEVLIKLARSRQEGVKEYLAANGVKPERMIMCNPAYTNNDAGDPRVDFSL
jgi:outer membrane protein OmpA-like peptidoglycan-associated protein